MDCMSLLAHLLRTPLHILLYTFRRENAKILKWRSGFLNACSSKIVLAMGLRWIYTVQHKLYLRELSSKEFYMVQLHEPNPASHVVFTYKVGICSHMYSPWHQIFDRTFSSYFLGYSVRESVRNDSSLTVNLDLLTVHPQHILLFSLFYGNKLYEITFPTVELRRPGKGLSVIPSKPS